MNKTIIIIVLGILSIASIGAVMSSSDRGEREDGEGYEKEHESEDHEYGDFRGGWLASRSDVLPVEDEMYRTECGSCHFAYQPGLLPVQAWKRIIDSLADHYGDDASLEPAESEEIRAYLTANGADRSKLSRSQAFAAQPAKGTMLPRITTTAYFRREHHEIPSRLVEDNQEVGSFSNCQSCHTGAERGIYNEHQVVIPGVGQWDD